MKILIIRHGDPDYSIDSLTPRGRIEAQLLANRLCKMDIKDFYVSTLGRAKDTAAYTLDKMNRTATVCDWLREFGHPIDRPDCKGGVPWDWYPKDWTTREEFYHKDQWIKSSPFAQSIIPSEYARVTKNFDDLLAKYGYVRENNYYRVVNSNTDTIALFCHLGLECVLVGHLTGISPVVLWHTFCAAPTSVTTIITEEKEKGIALFRVNCFADTSHLYVENVEPSPAGRFRETFDDK